MIKTESTEKVNDAKSSREERFSFLKTQFRKLQVLGLVTKIPTACGHYCHLGSLSSEDHIIVIPDDVEDLNKEDYGENNLVFTEHIRELQGKITVLGGKNVKNARAMFTGCKAGSLDLSLFNTANVEDMSFMFYACQAESIDLSSFNTSKVWNMDNMFSECRAKSLDLSSFDTSNLKRMEKMFYGIQVPDLDLSSFDTGKVENMYCMFCESGSDFIDLSSFRTGSIKNMNQMFAHCPSQIKIRATDSNILREYNERI